MVRRRPRAERRWADAAALILLSVGGVAAWWGALGNGLLWLAPGDRRRGADRGGRAAGARRDGRRDPLAAGLDPRRGPAGGRPRPGRARHHLGRPPRRARSAADDRHRDAGDPGLGAGGGAADRGDGDRPRRDPLAGRRLVAHARRLRPAAGAARRRDRHAADPGRLLDRRARPRRRGPADRPRAADPDRRHRLDGRRGRALRRPGRRPARGLAAVRPPSTSPSSTNSTPPRPTGRSATAAPAP